MGRRAAASLLLLLLSTPLAHADELSGDIAFASGDYTTAFQQWRALAQAGNASAMAAVGTLYDTGHGVKQDFATALQWYRRAAQAGDARAMFNVAVMYDSGRGTPPDLGEAVTWYKKAAAHGIARAAYNLGLIYRDGNGVKRDRPAAIRYFQQAAAGGLQAAGPNLLALGISEGAPTLAAARPVPENQAGAPPSERDASFQQAALDRAPPSDQITRDLSSLLPRLSDEAAKGNALAQYDVGYAYEHGIGEPTDPVRSYVFYLRAATSPVATLQASALKGAAEVGRSLSSEQHAQARDLLLSDAH